MQMGIYMYIYKSSAELKSLAKGKLLGKYGTVISAFIAIEAIILTISLLTSFAVDPASISGLAIQYAVSFIMELIVGIFTVGQIYLYFNISCNKPYNVTDIFYGFKAHPDKAITVKFLILVFTLLCFVPCIVLGVAYVLTNTTILLLFTSLAIVIGSAAAIYINLQFSQVFYLMLDFPNYTSSELLSLSKEVMVQHKGRFFYIQISFIPLVLLAVLSCGIGFLFLVPYMNMVCLEFYMDLIRGREANNTMNPVYNEASLNITI